MWRASSGDAQGGMWQFLQGNFVIWSHHAEKRRSTCREGAWKWWNAK